ncbi:MAG: DedA family protein [Halobacteriovoraceae bacterium]|nr:DedA family protein [Halobacteriovoraceae bacterium]
MISEETITQFFIQYAYSPYYVYVGVVAFMTMSSFGLPIPEEIVLVSCGFIAFMALHPGIYPPPSPDAIGVDLVTLSVVCFMGVLLSDILIFFIGKYFGRKIFETKFFKKHISEKNLQKVDRWYKKYGALVCGIFRFTPGVRFPGHMSCGMMGVEFWKFLLVDGLAALISVPTQVVLVAWYGKVILGKLKEFKLILFAVIGIVILVHLVNKYYFKKKEPNSSP